MNRKIVRYIQGTYRSEKRVPTIDEIKAKMHLRNTKQFYHYFRGLAAACEEAHVPPPLVRLQRVSAATAQRKGKIDQQPAPAILENPDPATASLQKQVEECEDTVTKAQRELDLHERKGKASQKMVELRTKIERLKNAEAAKTMPYNQEDYAKAMNEYFENHPHLQSRVQQVSSRLGWTDDFRSHLEEVVTDQFNILNHVAITWPDLCRRMGQPAVEMPVDADLPCMQWNQVIDDLTLSAEAYDYTKFDERLRNLRPDFRCSIHMVPVKHLGGPNFACPQSHNVYYPCPECRSPLNYDGIRFHCGSCLNRFLGL